MMNNRIKKNLERLELKRAAEKTAKLMNDPHWAPWLVKAEKAFRRCADQIGSMAIAEKWPAALRVEVDAVMDDLAGVIMGHIGLSGKPEPTWPMRWLEIFPTWLALIPMDLRLPAMIDMQAEFPRPTVGCPNHMRESWLMDWLRVLSWGDTSLPVGLSSASMGAVVRAVLDHADNLENLTAYCKKCGLLYPIRRNGKPNEILASCPHCGTVGKPDDGEHGWQWVTYLRGGN